MLVSLALRNLPGVAPSTARRLRRLALEMGYAPDPEITRLMHRLREGRFRSPGAVLGFLTEFPPHVLALHPTFYRMFLGASTRAHELGYRVEHFTVPAEAAGRRSLNRVLRARGIQGVLLGPNPRTTAAIPLESSRLCAVAYGYSTTAPALHRVMNDQKHTIELALERLHARGCRRPGLVMSAENDARVRHNWSAGFLGWCRRTLSAAPGVPIHDSPRDARATVAWFNAHRPDAILGVDMHEPLRALSEHGYAPPRAFAFANLDRQPEGPESHHAGVDQLSFHVGQTGVNVLVGALVRNEIGLPQHPQLVLTSGQWVEGATARRAARRRSKSTREGR
jgi:DNA-binding LacI/PurR family transcriptional regulator